MNNDKQKPVFEIRLGKIRACVWANATEAGGIRHNTELKRTFKRDKDSTWESSHFFSPTELLLAAEAARVAALWIFEREKEMKMPANEEHEPEL